MGYKCLICGGELPEKLPTFPKLYNMSQEQKDAYLSECVHSACCSQKSQDFASEPWLEAK